MKNFKEKLLAYFTKRNTFKIVVIELIVMGLLLCALLMMFVDVRVTLKGDETITVAAGSAYSEPGYSATADGRNVTDRVKVTGEVNTDVAGTYRLCYSARYLFSRGKAYRTVIVVRKDEGVTSASGVSITLKGDREMTIKLGEAFFEPGYRAQDKDGNDLTDQVQVTGEVDSSRAGTYRIIYALRDAKAYRSVTVEAIGETTGTQPTQGQTTSPQPSVEQPNGKVIYLTFDDGPGKYTQELLDVLKKYDAKATFFVVNTQYSQKEEMMKAIVAGGHAIGIHSMTHEWSVYDSEQAFLNDMYGMQKIIADATGVTTTLMRFPGGSSNTVSKKHCQGIMTLLTKKVTELGMQYFDWDVDSDDAGSAKDANTVAQNVIRGIQNAGRDYVVVLQHDIKGYSVDAVEQILKWGLENGYTFQALTPSSPTCHHNVNN